MDTLQVHQPSTSKQHQEELEQTSEKPQRHDLPKYRVGSIDVSLHQNITDWELIEKGSEPFDAVGSGGLHREFPRVENGYSDSASCHVSEVMPGGPVFSLAIANQQLYTISQTGVLSVRNPHDLSPTPTCSFDSKVPEVSTLAVDGEWIVTGHRDNKIRVWHRPHISGGGLLHTRLGTLPTTKEYMKNWAWKRNYEQLRRHHKRPWMEHADKISALAMGKEGLLYSASWDKSVKVWNLNMMKCEESFKAHDDAVNAMVVGDEDGVLYTGSADRTIKAWRRPTVGNRHEMVEALEGQESGVNAVALAGSRLYAGGSDGRIKVWRKKSKVECGWMEMEETLAGGHSRAVLSFDVVHGSSLVVSGSADMSVRVWQRLEDTNHKCVAVLQGHSGPVKSVTARMVEESNGLCAVYSGALDGSIKMWLLPLHELQAC